MDNIDEVVSGLFESFWIAGMVKVKKVKAKQLFTKRVKKEVDMHAFTEMLIIDVQTRLKLRQFGFAGTHPTTYLNQERWTDDIPEASNESKQATESHAERTHRQARQARERLGLANG